MIFLVIPALWLALIVVLVALCVAARRGDKDAPDGAFAETRRAA